MKKPIPKLDTQRRLRAGGISIADPPKTIEISDTVNSIIDVLKEQQKEIDELKKCKCVCHLSGNAQCAYCQCIAYTAMRSTGEYCECKKPTSILPHSMFEEPKCWHCNKPVGISEPQEDVTYTDEAIKIQNLLWNKFYAVITKEQAMEISDKILAIVKGE